LKVLLTGGTGFVGSAVLRQLLTYGYQVRVLVRETSDLSNLDGLNCDICFGDLTDKMAVSIALKDCHGLFHVAADYRIWTRHPEKMIKTNVLGTQTIMMAAIAANIEKIVYTSSVATLGVNSDEQSADEETPSSLEQMTGIYKKSKFLAEQEVRRMVVEQSLPAVIVNPSTPIGPRDIKPTPTGKVIVQAAKGNMPAYVKTGLNVVHVDDVARGHVLAYERGIIGERYILGGQNCALKEILDIVAEYSGRASPNICIPHNIALPIAYLSEAWAKIGQTDEPLATVDGVNMSRQKMYFTSAKATAILGYSHRPSKEAIRDAIEWFGMHGYLD
jgi:dihydroflavonol-4-reductase